LAVQFLGEAAQTVLISLSTRIGGTRDYAASHVWAIRLNPHCPSTTVSQTALVVFIIAIAFNLIAIVGFMMSSKNPPPE
jgi:hypothetical protein